MLGGTMIPIDAQDWGVTGPSLRGASLGEFYPFFCSGRGKRLRGDVGLQDKGVFACPAAKELPVTGEEGSSAALFIHFPPFLNLPDS